MNRLETRAWQLLEEAGIDTPPVPVEQLARRLGATLSFEPFDDDMSGVLYRDDNDIIIGVNSAHPQTRQRFTIAHECGHLLLHQGRAVFVDKAVRINLRDAAASRGEIKEEIEANAFAAALLMPEPFITQAIDVLARQSDDIDANMLIAGLAERFRVSPQAMEYRLGNVGIAIPR